MLRERWRQRWQDSGALTDRGAPAFASANAGAGSRDEGKKEVKRKDEKRDVRKTEERQRRSEEAAGQQVRQTEGWKDTKGRKKS